ncbi:MAG: flagellar motor protein MotD [Sinobacterium sp.]|nr:flagellar motor protein MotD [Sinobacterium sp.]
MARKKKHEDHINHEAWAIPFGDLMTLLLAFFVVMYAISSVNEGKYRAASASMHAAFSGLPRTVAPIQVGTNANTTTAPEVNMGQQIDRESTIEMPKSAAMVDDMDDSSESANIGIYEDENSLELMEEELREVLSDLIIDNVIQVTSSKDWIEVRIKSDLLFKSGQSELTPAALSSMQRFINVMNKFSNRMKVEGHTDNVPIKTWQFKSNWELSSARAISVVHLMQQEGINPRRLRVIAFGETKPIISNETIAGRQKNRRVNIIIMAMNS